MFVYSQSVILVHDHNHPSPLKEHFITNYVFMQVCAIESYSLTSGVSKAPCCICILKEGFPVYLRCANTPVIAHTTYVNNCPCFPA